IDDLFELSQIEVGALRLDIAPTPLPTLISETLETYRAQAQDNGITLECRVDPDVRPVAADGPRLRRVLRNLLDNAQRYTSAGGSGPSRDARPARSFISLSRLRRNPSSRNRRARRASHRGPILGAGSAASFAVRVTYGPAVRALRRTRAALAQEGRA